MTDNSEQPLAGAGSDAKVVDIAIRLTFVGLLAAWSLMLIGPFISVILWGVILAVALHPVFAWLRRILGGRGTPAAVLVTLLLLVILIGPASLLSAALVDNLQDLAGRVEDGTLRVPPPAASVRDWPLVGEQIYSSWSLAASNLGEALEQLGPQLKYVGGVFVKAAAGAGIGMLQFIAAVIIAGFLFVPAEKLVAAVRAFAKRVVEHQGDIFVTLAGNTIRNVARGVIGVSLLQSLLIGIGLLVAGVPGAGLLTIIALVLAIVQIGPGIVLLAAIIWAWVTLDVVYAVLLTAYMIPVGLFDNVLKPIIMSRGLTTPMLVILVGVIGGTLVHGLIGIFIGPIVLAVAHELLVFWVRGPAEGDTAGGEAGT